MDKLKAAHLQANLEYWRIDTILEADKAIKRVDRSRSLKLLSKLSKPLEIAIEMVKQKGETAKEIDNLINYTIRENDDYVIFDLYLNEIYFSTSEQLKAHLGNRAARAMKTLTRQQLIDNFEGEIKSTYTTKFTGEILESDGKELRITKDAV